MPRFFLYRDNEVKGPFTIRELSIIGIEPDDFVWNEIVEEWNEASYFSILELLFDEVDYYVAQDNEVYGPYELGDLASYKIIEKASVYTEKNGEWINITGQFRRMELIGEDLGQGQIDTSNANANFLIDNNGQIVRRSGETRQAQTVTKISDLEKKDWSGFIVVAIIIIVLIVVFASS